MLHVFVLVTGFSNCQSASISTITFSCCICWFGLQPTPWSFASNWTNLLCDFGKSYGLDATFDMEHEADKANEFDQIWLHLWHCILWHVRVMSDTCSSCAWQAHNTPYFLWIFLVPHRQPHPDGRMLGWFKLWVMTYRQILLPKPTGSCSPQLRCSPINWFELCCELTK